MSDDDYLIHNDVPVKAECIHMLNCACFPEPREDVAVAEVLAAVLHDNGVCDAMFAHYGPAKKCERVARALVESSVLPGPECRWCPPGCPRCEPDDCECYRHQDWPDKTTDPDWPYRVERIIAERERAAREAGIEEGVDSTWHLKRLRADWERAAAVEALESAESAIGALIAAHGHVSPEPCDLAPALIAVSNLRADRRAER